MPCIKKLKGTIKSWDCADENIQHPQDPEEISVIFLEEILYSGSRWEILFSIIKKEYWSCPTREGPLELESCEYQSIPKYDNKISHRPPLWRID